MNKLILDFIKTKSLSLNSQKAYQYDLQQFADLTEGIISETKLKRYEQSLMSLKASAQKRKISTINQFLFFLYEHDKVDRFYKIKNRVKVLLSRELVPLMDFSALEQTIGSQTGRLIALLIVELGLTPSEIIQLRLDDIDFDFQIVTVRSQRGMRVLEVSDALLVLLAERQNRTFLFDNKGRGYSRQWLFTKLSEYLQVVGLSHLSAQKLREQYILREKAQGTSILELAKKLGLKSPATLERYYKN